jgi:drug/metabolite transporter (DMT)-like permease
MLPLSYQKAPSFFQPWFFGIACLTVFGSSGSILYFHESVHWYNMVGALLAVLGCVLVGL